MMIFAEIPLLSNDLNRILCYVLAFSMSPVMGLLQLISDSLHITWSILEVIDGYLQTEAAIVQQYWKPQHSCSHREA